MPRARWSALTWLISSKSSGRMPAMMFRPASMRPSRSATSCGSLMSTIGSFATPFSIFAGRKFMPGDPMKPATNRFFGLL